MEAAGQHRCRSAIERKNALTIFRYEAFTMARGKQPLVSHALPKQQTLLDCFLEAQAHRLGHRSRPKPPGQSSATASGSRDDEESRGIADEEPADEAEPR